MYTLPCFEKLEPEGKLRCGKYTSEILKENTDDKSTDGKLHILVCFVLDIHQDGDVPKHPGPADCWGQSVLNSTCVSRALSLCQIFLVRVGCFLVVRVGCFLVAALM